MALADAALVMMFDFTRFELRNFGGWHGERTEELIEKEGIYSRFSLQAGQASTAAVFRSSS